MGVRIGTTRRAVTLEHRRIVDREAADRGDGVEAPVRGDDRPDPRLEAGGDMHVHHRVGDRQHGREQVQDVAGHARPRVRPPDGDEPMESLLHDLGGGHRLQPAVGHRASARPCIPGLPVS